MSKFKNSEVMIKYAAILAEQDGFVKEAWTWRDIVTELGIDAAITGTMAGAGAMGYMGGAAAGGGLAGAGAAVGIAGAPIWAVLLGGTALTMGIWYLTKQMDDNLIDLLDRLEDLDPNVNAEATVKGWIESIRQLQPVMQVSPTTTDLEEKARMNGQKVMGMKYLHSYLLQMQADWPQVEANLDDMVFDSGQAEHAINETTRAVGESLAQMQQLAQQSVEVEKKNIEEQAKTQKEQGGKGVAGKGQTKSNKSPAVKELQININKIIDDRLGGAGTIVADGIYGPITADALVGVISSDWNISTAVAESAKLNYSTIKNIEFMRGHPNLIQKVNSVLSGIAGEGPSATQVAGGPRKNISRERTQAEPGRPLSTRDIRKELLS